MTTWADQFNTYEEACIYYGIETPAQLAAEDKYWAQEEHIQAQDEIEMNGPKFGHYRDYSSCGYATNVNYNCGVDDEIPF